VPVAERRKRADEIIKEYSEKLKKGWLPISNRKTAVENPDVEEAIKRMYNKVYTFNYLAAEFLEENQEKWSDSTYMNYRSNYCLNRIDLRCDFN
jgi:hypothetical protein